MALLHWNELTLDVYLARLTWHRHSGGGHALAKTTAKADAVAPVHTVRRLFRRIADCLAVFLLTMTLPPFSHTETRCFCNYAITIAQARNDLHRH